MKCGSFFKPHQWVYSGTNTIRRSFGAIESVTPEHRKCERIGCEAHEAREYKVTKFGHGINDKVDFGAFKPISKDD